MLIFQYTPGNLDVEKSDCSSRLATSIATKSQKSSLLTCIWVEEFWDLVDIICNNTYTINVNINAYEPAKLIDPTNKV